MQFKTQRLVACPQAPKILMALQGGMGKQAEPVEEDEPFPPNALP